MNRANRKATISLVAFILIAPGALSHIGYVGQGIHFKEPSVDFGVPPPKYANRWQDSSMTEGDAWRPGTIYFQNNYGESVFDGDDYNPDRAEKKRLAFIRRAQTFERRGQIKLALDSWRIAWHKYYVNHSELNERLVLLRFLVKHPNLKGSLRVLSGLPIGTHSKPMPAPETVSKSLRPFILYFQALQANLAPTTAAHLLISVAAKYPASPLAESALIMVPRTLLASRHQEVKPSDSALAEAAMHRLMLRHPHTRFRFDVVGWRGRIAYLAGDMHLALTYYRKQLAMAGAGGSILSPIDSIEMCERKLGRKGGAIAAELIRYERAPSTYVRWETANALDRETGLLAPFNASSFGHLVRSDPELLTAYLDYRLDMTDATPDLLAFSHCLAMSHAKRSSKGHVFARLAEAALALGKGNLAQGFSRKAMTFAESPDDRAMATFVRGTLAKRVGRFALARRDYERIRDSYSRSYLLGGALENIALLDERENRLGAALDIYRKLKYSEDVAYMIDIRMSPRQLKEYVSRRPSDKERHLLHLSLGFRYLRNHQWNEAKAAFRSVPKPVRLKLVNDESVVRTADGDNPLQDPLQTANDLVRLERKISRAHRGNSRAEAMLNLAAYYYSHHSLLLYNAAIWKGARQYSIEFSWNSDAASKADDRALDAHHWQHETYAQALLICRQIVRNYPGTSVATRAAYRGACAADHLAGFSEYWRWENSRINLSREASRLMRLAEKSPNAWIAARARKYQAVFEDEAVERKEDSWGYGIKDSPRYLGQGRLTKDSDEKDSQ